MMNTTGGSLVDFAYLSLWPNHKQEDLKETCTKIHVNHPPKTEKKNSLSSSCSFCTICTPQIQHPCRAFLWWSSFEPGSLLVSTRATGAVTTTQTDRSIRRINNPRHTLSQLVHSVIDSPHATDTQSGLLADYL